MKVINKCPACGSDKGIEFRWKEIKNVWMDFEGTREDSSIEGIFPKTGKCIDCGHRIKLSRISEQINYE